jgi:hypothetical protein
MLTKFLKASPNISIIMRHKFTEFNDITPLTEDETAIQSAALEFAKTKLLPFANEWDQNHHFPVDVIKEAGQQGFGKPKVLTPRLDLHKNRIRRRGAE